MPLTSYLKYPGGKRKLVPNIQSYWEPYRDRRLVELFVGSGSVAMGLEPDHALLNDLNPHVVNLHQWVQRGLKVTLPMRNDRQTYLTYRQWFNSLIHHDYAEMPTAAQLLYYLNHTGFNGLIRFNQRGKYNVPFGKYKTITYLTDFSPWRSLFANWQFISGDFSRVPLAPTDFVYADPPYDAISPSAFEQLTLLEEVQADGVGFTTYAAAKFTWADQVRLVRHLAQHPGPVLISNAVTPRIEHLYRRYGFAIEYIQVQRSIDNTGDRPKAPEILAFKPPA